MGDPEDFVGDSLMHFEDDAVSAIAERSMGDEKLKMSVFLSLLESAPEFRGANVGIFSIESSEVTNDNKIEKLNDCDISDQESIERVKSALNLCSSATERQKLLTFETRERALESTRKLREILSTASPGVKVELTLSSQELLAIKRDNPPPVVCNMLTVKRRRKD